MRMYVSHLGEEHESFWPAAFFTTGHPYKTLSFPSRAGIGSCTYLTSKTKEVSHFREHKDLFDQPLRLSKKQMHDPDSVIRDFFVNCHLWQCKEFLWEWLVCTLSSREALEMRSVSPGDLVYYYQQIETLLEAALLISKRSKNMKK
jgi:hypothetical protein